MALVKLSTEAQLSQVQSDIDELLCEVSAGVRSPIHFEELEERAEAIAGSLRDAFRHSAVVR